MKLTMTDVLTIVFVYLKLTNQIDWSWIYVTLPFWGGFCLLFVYMAFKAFVKDRWNGGQGINDPHNQNE